VACRCGYLSGARCRLAYGPADTIATHCLLLQEIQIGVGFTFLVPAHPCSPGQNPESRKMVVVVVVSEIWPIRKENEVELLKAEMRMIRWMCGVKQKDTVPSKGLRERLGLDDIISVLQQNRL